MDIRGENGAYSICPACDALDVDVLQEASLRDHPAATRAPATRSKGTSSSDGKIAFQPLPRAAFAKGYERYCIVSHLEEAKKCFWCDSSPPFADNPALSHTVDNLVHLFKPE
ncbi:unnamed protein product [Darwinula stevensoni]|uniref:Uncharacterized protein n=1 Tax=Darwinula stevensoni TaxID=69355 RepID=A0A7R8X550_9CRUS|nr:unnamed protein product [Darwinula stevensoni]CAG0885643.1 unnamed protein product [Darwinula stevensoni]